MKLYTIFIIIFSKLVISESKQVNNRIHPHNFISHASVNRLIIKMNLV